MQFLSSVLTTDARKEASFREWGAKTRPFAFTEYHHSAVLFVANNMPSLAKMCVAIDVKRHGFYKGELCTHNKYK
jgi:hypothetical protein